MEEDRIRLNKFLADHGVCSRREADRLIEQGRVAVNGQTAAAGCKVTERDSVTVNGKPLQGRPPKVVLAFYKPVGVTCTEQDRHAEKIINDYVKYPVRVTYAGRLDRDSEGLLLLTNDGELIEAVMRGLHRHEKEYIVTVNKPITDEFIEKMAGGVPILDTVTRKCRVEKFGKFKFRIILTQGLNRQIRRMCEYLGYKVTRLSRVRVMNIRLGDLKPGEYRAVTEKEISKLYELIKDSSNETVIPENKTGVNETKQKME